MSGAFYNDLHPHGHGDWIRNRLRLKTETIEAVFVFFLLWIALMLFSYVVSFLIYWVLNALGIVQKTFYSLLMGLFH
jgi:hypothetical protein